MSVAIVLIEPRNPLNIGAAARAASNFGFNDLRLVRPYRAAVDEARSAAGGAWLLEQAQQFATLPEAIHDCTVVFGTSSRQPRELALPIHTLAAMPGLLSNTRSALLFGSEKTGLSNEDMSHCHHLIRIPTRPEHDSMNLGQAVALCLYELIRKEGEPALYEPQRHEASQEAMQRLTLSLNEALTLAGYPATNITDERTRQLLLRLQPSARDADILQGMLRQILWKLRAEPEQK
jgi:TrmH family RNA methyltransferase